VRRVIIGLMVIGIVGCLAAPSMAKWIWRDGKWIEGDDSEPIFLPTPSPSDRPSVTPIAPSPPPDATPPTVVRPPAPAPVERPVTGPSVVSVNPPSATRLPDGQVRNPQSPPGEEAALFEKGRAEITAGSFGTAAGTLKDFLKKYPTSGRRDEAMWLRGHALLAAGDHYAAFEQFEDLVTQYGGSPHYREALVEEMKIAEAFMTGTHRKVMGIPMLVSSEGEGVEILRKVYEHQPTGDLADAVVQRVADYYWTKGRWAEAEDYYDKYCREFPNGPTVRQAELRRAKCAFERCRGPRYDTTSLETAQKRLSQFKQKYPAEAEQEGVSAQLDLIRDMQAQGLYETAAHYRRSGQPLAAAYYAELLQKRYPDSPWSELAARFTTSAPPK
jgi:outer membrane protein assembly factor BamD (BamD/ComL family)